MAVVFNGTSALWLWRTTLRLGDPLSPRASEQIIKEIHPLPDQARTARWAVEDLLGYRWDGSHGTGQSVLAPHPDRMVRVHPVPGASGIYVAALADVLDELAPELGTTRTALLMLEFCGTYRLQPRRKTIARIHTAPRTRTTELRKEASVGRSESYVQALEYVTDLCASPIESALSLFMYLPVHEGGFEIPKAHMHEPIVLPEALNKKFQTRIIRPDFCWPGKKVVFEFEGMLPRALSNNSPHKANARISRFDAYKSQGYKPRGINAETILDYARLESTLSKLRKSLRLKAVPENDETERTRRDLYAELIRRP